MNMLEGQILNNLDPQGLARLFVVVPALTGINKGIWAKACLPARTFQLPGIGEWVWLIQTHPDGQELVWMGHSPHLSVENYTQNIAERNGTAVPMILNPPTKSNPRPSVGEKHRTAEEIAKNPKPTTCPDRHTPLKTPGGITFFADDNVLNNRYQDVKTPIEFRKKMHTLLTKDDDFHWGIEDPLGNKIVVEHLEGETFLTVAVQEENADKVMSMVFNTKTQEFSIVSKDFEISHNAVSKEMFIRDINKNQIEMNEDGIRLVPKDGAGNLVVSCVNADGDEEPLVLGNQLKTILDTLYDALNTWVVVPSDGGAALKLSLASFLTSYASYKASGAYLTRKSG
jgi:hypothetical protein